MISKIWSSRTTEEAPDEVKEQEESDEIEKLSILKVNDPPELVVCEDNVIVGGSEIFRPNGLLRLSDVIETVSKAFENNPHSHCISQERMAYNCGSLILSKHQKYSCLENYWIDVLAFEEMNELGAPTFIVEFSLMSKKEKGDLISLSTSQRQRKDAECEKLALQIFEDTCATVRKELCTLEFPEFPEGAITEKPIRSIYHIGKSLGAGAYGVVYDGRHAENNKRVAVKSVDRDYLSTKSDAAIFNEVNIMSNIDHPHIAKLQDFFIKDRYYLLILEFVEGGDLKKRVQKKKYYCENEAKDCIRTILEAVNYCHQNKVVHLDLNPNNIVLNCNENDADIKLIDFGMAQRIGSKPLTSAGGTPAFMAPEVICKEPFDAKADMWSIGAIIYFVLSGTYPFQGTEVKDIFACVLYKGVKFEDEIWLNISKEAKDLIMKLLDLDQETRYSAEQALSSSWLQES